eukprot:Hpha_TRINITY_DN15444_c1_g7::TRINITY_DN15444_c1_g7_i2::g.176167::m.176167
MARQWGRREPKIVRRQEPEIVVSDGSGDEGDGESEAALAEADGQLGYIEPLRTRSKRKWKGEGDVELAASISDFVADLLQFVKDRRDTGEKGGQWSWVTAERLRRAIDLQFGEGMLQRAGGDAEVKVLRTYERACRRVDTAIMAMLGTREVLTLWDIFREVPHRLGKPNWEALGVLHSPEDNALVRSVFGLDDTVTLPKGGPPKVTGADILTHACGCIPPPGAVEGEGEADVDAEGKGHGASLEDVLWSLIEAKGILPPPENKDLRWMCVWAREGWSSSVSDIVPRLQQKEELKVAELLEGVKAGSERRARLVRWLLSIVRFAEGEKPLAEGKERKALSELDGNDVRMMFNCPRNARPAVRERVRLAVRRLVGPVINPESWSDVESVSNSSEPEEPAYLLNLRQDGRTAKEVAAIREQWERQWKAQRPSRKRLRLKLQRLELEEQRQKRKLWLEHIDRQRQKDAFAKQSSVGQEGIVTAVKAVLVRTPRPLWGSRDTRAKIESALVASAAVPGSVGADVVADRCGGMANVILTAAAELTAASTEGPVKEAEQPHWPAAQQEDDAPEAIPMEEKVANVEAAVQTAVQRMAEVDQSTRSTIAILNELEAKTLEALSCGEGDHFVDIECGTFLSFIEEHPQLAAPLLDSSLSAPRVQALRAFVAESLEVAAGESDTIALTDEQKGAVVAAAERHAGISFGDARFASPEALIDDVCAAPPENENEDVSHLSALSCALPDTLELARYAPRGMTPQALISRVRSLPPLTEIRGALLWDELLETSFGSLGELLAEESVPYCTAGPARVLANGKTEPELFYLLPAAPTPDAFRVAVETGDGRTAAGIAAALCVRQGGRGGDELLLARHCQEALEGEETDAARVRLIRDALFALPPDLRAVLGARVFISPFRAVAPHALRSLIEGASGGVRLALRQVGCVLGLAALRDDYERWLKGDDGEAGARGAGGLAPAAAVKTAAAPAAAKKKAPAKQKPETAAAPATVVSVPAETEAEQATKKEVKESPTSPAAKEGPSAQMTEDSPYKVVANIRRSRFGIGAELGGEAGAIHKENTGMLSRAIDRLASDLYSSDAHFVFELLQNADDNAYLEDVVPEVRFDVTEKSVVLSNNERGFSARDVSALCNVGSSTKAKMEGYIGMKGIGFKSVFRVSNAPEIHSNGFHFNYNLKGGAMGYIVPTWLGETGGHPDLALAGEGWTTQIALPLKSEFTGERQRLMTVKFDDLHPSLLLFLRKVRGLVVNDHLTGTVRSMRRRDIGGGVTEVEVDETVRRWLVHRRRLAAAVPRGDLRGAQVTTELALAFPLVEEGTELEEQEVFAFLPLRQCGLRFVLQGDWILPSSREDVDATAPWNLWLRSECAPLFVSALQLFQEEAGPEELPGAVSRFLAFVPDPSSVVGFFRPLAIEIRERLLKAKCLLSRCGEMCRPAECVFVPDTLESDPINLTEELITPKTLWEASKHRYVHPRVILPSALAKHLRVGLLGVTQLLDVARWAAESPSQRVPGGKWIPWLGKWLLACHECLEGRCGPVLPSRKGLVEELRRVRVMPLYNGQLTCVADGGMFFPGEHMALTREQAARHPVRLVDADLLESVSGDARTRLRLVLRELGVGQMTERDTAEQVVLPIFADEEQFNSLRGSREGKQVMRRMLNFLMRFSAPIGTGILGKFRDIVRLETAQGLFVCPKQEPIFFSTAYGNPHEFENMHLRHLPPQAGRSRESPLVVHLVGDGYLQTGGSKTEWREFLSTHLGVRCFFEPKAVRRNVVSKASSEWAQWDGEWPFPEPAELTDHVCRPLLLVLQAVTSKRIAVADDPGTALGADSVLQCIAEGVDREWECFEGACEATGQTASGEEVCVDSSLVLRLREAAWMPTLYHGLQSTEGLLVHSEGVVRLLQNGVPVMRPQLRSDGLLEALGARREICASDILSALKSWSTQKSRRFSRQHAVSIYSELLELANKEECSQEVRDAFDSSDLIIVPDANESRLWREEGGEGALCTFCSTQQLTWTDSVAGTVLEIAGRNVLGGCRAASLDYWYPSKLCAFFLAVGVKEAASFRAQIAFLQNAARSSSLRRSAVAAYSVAALVCWTRQINSGTLVPERDAGELGCSAARTLPVFPSLGQEDMGSFATEQEPRLLVNDLIQDEARAGFEKSAVMRLLSLEVAGKQVEVASARQALEQVYAAPFLSRVVEEDGDTEQLDRWRSREVHVSIARLLSPIQRYLKQRLPRVHAALTQAEEHLQRVTVLVVGRLRCVLRVPTGPFARSDVVVGYNRPSLLAGDRLVVVRRLGAASKVKVPDVVRELLRGLLRKLGTPEGFALAEEAESSVSGGWAELDGFVREISLVGERANEYATVETGLPPLSSGELPWTLGPLAELPPPPEEYDAPYPPSGTEPANVRKDVLQQRQRLPPEPDSKDALVNVLREHRAGRSASYDHNAPVSAPQVSKDGTARMPVPPSQEAGAGRTAAAPAETAPVEKATAGEGARKRQGSQPQMEPAKKQRGESDGQLDDDDDGQLALDDPPELSSRQQRRLARFDSDDEGKAGGDGASTEDEDYNPGEEQDYSPTPWQPAPAGGKGPESMQGKGPGGFPGIAKGKGKAGDVPPGLMGERQFVEGKGWIMNPDLGKGSEGKGFMEGKGWIMNPDLGKGSEGKGFMEGK